MVKKDSTQPKAMTGKFVIALREEYKECNRPKVSIGVKSFIGDAH